MSKQRDVEIGEALIRSLIKEIGPHRFAIALSNASAFGEVFDGEFTDQQLADWHDGIDEMIEAAS